MRTAHYAEGVRILVAPSPEPLTCPLQSSAGRDTT